MSFMQIKINFKRHHGYQAVPVNVAFDTLAPRLEDIEAAITEKVLPSVSHL